MLRVTPIADRRYALELALQPPPAELLRDLVAEGAHLVSLNPIRDTLEDFFIRQVQKQAAPRIEASAGAR